MSVALHRWIERLRTLPIFYKVLVANTTIVVAGAIVGTTLTLLSTGSTDHIFELVTLFGVTGTLLSAIINWAVLRAAFQPIRALEHTADQVRQGKFDVRAPTVPFSDPSLDALTATFNAMLDAVVAYQGRLRELSQRVLTAQEQERQRIARELHDDPAQTLTAQLLRIKTLEASATPVDRTALSELASLTAAALESIRAIAHELRPPVLDDFGLPAALQSLADQQRQRFGLPVSVVVHGQARRLPPDVELALYRIAQEALTNAAKHANAQRALTELTFGDERVTLAVHDDGRGFSLRDLSLDHGELGLFGMRERAELVGGSLQLRSTPGAGTSVLVTVPLNGKLTSGPQPALAQPNGRSNAP